MHFNYKQINWSDERRRHVQSLRGQQQLRRPTAKPSSLLLQNLRPLWNRSSCLHPEGLHRPHKYIPSNPVQLLCTVFFILLSMYSESFFAFQVNNMWMLYLTLILGFGVQIYLFCCQGGRDPPENYICCGIFTFCEAYLVSFISSATGRESGNGVVLLAGVYTLGKH